MTETQRAADSVANYAIAIHKGRKDAARAAREWMIFEGPEHIARAARDEAYRENLERIARTYNRI